MPPTRTNPEQMSIRHEPDNTRFVAAIGAASAVLEYSSIDDETLDYSHTFVPSEVRGQGIASAITEHALKYALDNDFAVIPSCPFVAAFIQSNPKYRKLVKR